MTERRTGRRTLLRGLAAAALAISAIMSGADGTSAQAKLRIGIQSIPPDELMKAKDWFSKYGLAVDLVQFSSGGDMMQAFVAGRIDVANGGSTRLVTLAANQPELFKIIAVHQFGGERYGVLVPTDSKAKSLEDLKGKRIGMLPGSGASEAFALYLKKKHLEESDFQLVNMKAQDIRSAVQQKLVDAGIAWEPHVAIAETLGAAKRIASMKDVTESPNFYFVSRKFAEANPKAVAQFLAGLIDLARTVRTDPAQASTLASEHVGQRGVSVPKEAMELAFSRIQIGRKVGEDLIAELVPIAESMKASNRIQTVPDFMRLVDNSFYEEAERLVRARD